MGCRGCDWWSSTQARAYPRAPWGCAGWLRTPVSGNTVFLSHYYPSPTSGAPLPLSRADVSFPAPLSAVQVSLWPWAVTKDCSKSGLGFLKRQSAVRIIREAHSAGDTQQSQFTRPFRAQQRFLHTWFHPDPDLP